MAVLPVASLCGAGLLGGVASASAATFTVNSTGDQADAIPGTGGCATTVATCTLRAAIQEANHVNNPGADQINFAAGFNGTAGSSTIALGSPLPAIMTQVTINGGDCDPGAAAKPCVGVSASPGAGMLSVSASSGAISGLSLTGGARGVLVIGGSGSSVRGCWFGLGLDGSKSPLNAGVEINNSTPTATAMTIGGSTPAQRNVFSYTAIGVNVSGADSNVITGNYFAALPNGTLAPNPAFATAMKLQGLSLNAATNNRFGGPDAGTPGVCDGECNLVIGGGGPLLLGSGVAPAADNTSVVGNFFGLALDGVTAMPIGLQGSINSGIATNTTIGGPAAADRNYVDAGTTNSQGTLQINVAATGMVVQNNFFGLSASGTQVVANADEAILNFAPGTEIRDNTFSSAGNQGADGELSLRDGGNGVIVTGNSFGVGSGGADVVTNIGDAPLLGISSNSNQIGGTSAGQGNVFGFANDLAINIGASGNDGDSNTIVGNRIGTDVTGTASYPGAEGGILISGGSTDNVVGGNTAAAENVISNTGQVDGTKAAVGVTGSAANRNALLRNRGSNNGGLFFDLIPDAGPGNSLTIGANSFIQAPTVGTLSTTTITGSGASANAVLRAYRTLGTGGDVQEFIGSATEGTAGNWSITFAPVQANGACVFVNQTDTVGNSSELTTAQAVGGGSCDADPPNTVVNPGQPTLFDDSTPTIFFGTNPVESPVTYACALNPPGGVPVVSPDCVGGTYTPSTALADGTYTVSVAARDAVGNQDPTPATHTFTVDTTAPVVTIDSGPGQGSTTTDATPEFTFSATDLTAVTFQCRFDADAFAPCSGAGTHTPAAGLTDAPHTFDVRGTDALAHASTASRAFTVNAIPPQTTITKRPKATTHDRTPTFRFKASEAGSTFKCKLDKGAVKPCSSPFKKKVKPGKHTFKVRATDSAGNADPTPAKARWKVRK